MSDELAKVVTVVGLVGSFFAGGYAILRWAERDRATYHASLRAWGEAHGVEVHCEPIPRFEARLEGRGAWLEHHRPPATGPRRTRGPARHRVGVTLAADPVRPRARTLEGISNFSGSSSEPPFSAVGDAQLDELIEVAGDRTHARSYFTRTRRQALLLEVEALRAIGFEGVAMEGARLWAEGVGLVPADRLDPALQILMRLSVRLETTEGA